MVNHKKHHVVRDPIHDFISFDENEHRLIGSQFFQRLRSIHQLAMTYLVYPGASHKRFEHSLGVMELVGRAFDTVTAQHNLSCDQAHDLLNQAGGALPTLRNSLRFAALCHDLGHLPFSHAAEKELLQPGWDHEKLTLDIINEPTVSRVLKDSYVDPDVVARLALGAEKYNRLTGDTLKPIEAILAELIVGDAFGVDRMDYLLRDAYHCGVPYGRFDHHRLLMSLRLLHDESGNPKIGVTESALLTTHGMLQARASMYQTVYFHPVRKVYDRHLVDFLKAWLPDGKYPSGLDAHLHLTDDEVMSAIRASASSDGEIGALANRILKRQHFKRVKFSLPDVSGSYKRADIVVAIEGALLESLGRESVRRISWDDKPQSLAFPFYDDGGRVKQSPAWAGGQQSLQEHAASLHEVYVSRELAGKARELVHQDLTLWQEGKSDSKILEKLTNV